MASGTRLPARWLQALLLLCCFSLPAIAEDAKKKKKGDDEANKRPMPHHSFAVPMDYNSLLDDWVLSGASLFEKERMLMHPGVHELAGFAWTKQRVLTNDFQASFQFRVTTERFPGTEGSYPPSDQGFAFWYVHENMAKEFNEQTAIKGHNWGAGLRDQGMSFFGSKGKFQGFGTVFSAANKKQQVSLVTNDGTKELTESDLSSAHSKEVEFRNSINAAQLQLRVNKKSIKGFFKQSPSLSWQPCFEFESPTDVQPGGYIGFSAWSGTGGESRVSDLVSIVALEMTNYDESSLGEEMQDVPTQVQDQYKDMLMDDKRHFADQKAQTEHLTKLVDMIGDHLKTAKPAEEKIYAGLQGVTKRMGSLGDDCGELVQETRLLLASKGEVPEQHNHKNNVETMKNDIIGLRKLLVKDSVTHRAKLDAVSKNVAEVMQKSKNAVGAESFHKINKQSERLEQTVSSRGSQMSWMLFCMVIAILGIGGLMFNRMQYYEKKHFI